VKIFNSTFIQNTICVVYLGIVELGDVEGLHSEEIGVLNIL
jgi:hypothetical protein